MDLNSGKLITRARVVQIPITENIIKAVNAMAAEQGITSFKITNKRGIIYHPADRFAGVDHDPNIDPDYDEEQDDDYTDSDDETAETEPETDLELEDEDYDRIEQEEINDIVADEPPDPTNRVNHDEPPEVETVEDEDEPEEPEPEPEAPEPDEPPPLQPARRSSRLRKTIDDRWTYTHNQTSMVSPRKLKVRFVNAALYQLEDKHNLKREGIKPNGRDIEYEPQMAALIARLIVDINTKATVDELTFAQQFILQKGLREFGEEGYQAALKEIAQLHKRMCFTPIAVQSMTDEERRKAVEALLFSTEKRDKTIKGRMVYNGKPTRDWLSREESSSPTVSLESIFLTSIIDAKEERDVMTTDIPNASIHVHMPDVHDGKARVIMKIAGVLVNSLVELAPETYGPHVV